MKVRPLVVIESPYAASTPEGIAANVEYARACMMDSLSRGEAPIASHLLYTQPGILRDEREGERERGIECGFLWGEHAHLIAYYVDRGWSRGMEESLLHWTERGIMIEHRGLPRFP